MNGMTLKFNIQHGLIHFSTFVEQVLQQLFLSKLSMMAPVLTTKNNLLLSIVKSKPK